MSTFDYIIAGAGSAGCVLANRLSTDPATKVLLIEAGGKDRNVLLRIPKGAGKLFDDPRYMWHYTTTPFGPRQHTEKWMRGKVIGGSSSINGMVYNRGNRADYDDLEMRGNKGWGWDNMLPIFTSLEDNAFGPSPTRGVGGPVHVSVARDPDPLCQEMIDAGINAGLTGVEDVNESDAERIGLTPATIKAGRRVSAATAFLKPILRRPNLTVYTATTVRRIIFERGAAVGVEIADSRGATADVRAAREVIVALGSLGSPKVLQLSGVGPRDVLTAAGVRRYLHRDNVGRRMREHRCATLRLALRDDLGYNRQLSGRLAQAVTGARYLASRRGPLAAASFDVIAFVKSGDGAHRVDGQLLLGPWTIPPYNVGEPVVIERAAGISCLGMVLRPTSQGSVEITCDDPAATLRVDPNYLSSPEDRQRAIGLYRRMRTIVEQSPIADRIRAETYPGVGVDDDDAIVDAVLDGGYCGYHAVGSCAMGPHDDDVVDGELRVRGVDRLRVVDCSVMPAMVAGNLNGPMMAMAWRAADFIQGC